MFMPLLLTLVGLILLLTGMKTLRYGLEKYAGSHFKQILNKLTATPLKSILCGIAATGLLQSSTALTVTAISFVDAGLINFENTLGLILGSNIGATLTPQLLSLPIGKIMIWFILPALFGSWLLKSKKKYLLFAFAGLGIMFLSLQILGSAVIPLADEPFFYAWLHQLNNSYPKSILMGTILSAVLHSSSATTGIVMILTEEGWLNLPTSLAFIFGANIGTCITALVVSFFASRAAQRVALFHILLNVFGVILFYPFLHPLANVLCFFSGNLSRQIANAHTLFNFASSVLVFPLLPYVSRLLKKIR